MPHPSSLACPRGMHETTSAMRLELIAPRGMPLGYMLQMLHSVRTAPGFSSFIRP